MNTATPSRAAPPALSATLRAVHVGLREDLEVSRHVFRGEPCYIVRDPMTFQTQRLSAADYGLFVMLHAGRSLGVAFDDLCQRGIITPADEESFYEFVVGLHRLGFLQLPISDDKVLYRRYQLRQRVKRREKIMGFLFLRVPLWNPNAFLDRTVDRFRFLFQPWFLVFWLVLMATAGFVVAARWGELRQPVYGLLVTQNLPLLWATLIVLKLFHEMGHAYACKHYGGHVPEMGMYLILFTPCAYMDATAAWGFPRKRQRLIVSLAGMYVESLFAALALFVWAATEPSLLNAVAYNALFLAGVVTVLFNVNPLMRYDGYYILSDWLEIPNLRARAQQHVMSVLKKLFLGLRPTSSPPSRRVGWMLLAFGSAATVYRITLLIALASILASRVFIVGAIVGVGYLGMILVTTMRKLIRYLWHAVETQPVRVRAVALGVITFLLIPAAAFWVPLPSSVQAAGLVTNERETVVRATADGFLNRLAVAPGQHVEAGDRIAELSSDAPAEELATAQARWRAAQIRRDAFQASQPGRSLQYDIQASAQAAAWTKAQEDLLALSPCAPHEGRVVQAPRETDTGRFIRRGDPLVVIASGAWRVRGVLSETQVIRSRPQVGSLAEFRPAAQPDRAFTGRVVNVAPSGSRAIALTPLTHLGGGEVAVEPTSGVAAQPYFEVVIELAAAADGLTHGMTGQLRLAAERESLAVSLSRPLLRFWNRLFHE